MPIPRDTLWKAIIEDLFEDFCRYFFPEWSEGVADFSRSPEFLDKELDEIYPEREPGKRYADKLVKVFTKGGGEQWILIHVEVQGYQDPGFPERMFTYFHRIRDRHRAKIMAIAILTDPDPSFRPGAYRYLYGDTEAIYRFGTFKLLEKTEAELDMPLNPFSAVMLTAKKALGKRNLSDAAQLAWKRDLVLSLKTAGYPLEKIRRLLHFIRTYVSFRQESAATEFSKIVSSTFKQRENMGIEEAILRHEREEGLKEGLKEGIKEGVKEGEYQAKVKGIQKALQKQWDISEIADLFEVSPEFVVKVQRGEL